MGVNIEIKSGVPLPDTPAIKQCLQCGEEKPETTEYFYYGSKVNSGLVSPCKECRRRDQKVYHEKTAERKKANARAWYQANKEITKQRAAGWVKVNRNKRKQAALKYHRSHPEKAAFHRVNRRSRELNATPLWSDGELMQLVYAEALHRGLHADHIVPLAGKNVCGLHVYYNMQLLTDEQNKSKLNKWPYAPQIPLCP